MTAVARKLSTSFEGALAGGGDPATSPLYVFGPFLALIVPAGVAAVTFGASIWLVVLTIATVSAMYRLVMGWVTDGSGGSGLSEEELGSPAVKLNAGITFVEYTLTFAVSIAALVTFIADRIPALDERVLGVPQRTFVAIGFSLLTGWLVNRGPRSTARAFGPATGAVLLLLWVMVVATIARDGLRLPSLQLRAFTPPYLHFTLGGFARILAVMTGIEVFANLVPAYSGTRAEQSRKAFRSLAIIMGTTSVAMLVVGPAVLEASDPARTDVSVFTQTMDALLPHPVAVAGTVVGVAVLLSASAASALGLQNLFVGLHLRRYLPGRLATLNRFGVAPAPVWIEVSIVSAAFVALGTDETTYLAVYAAGVFILLSMTGWAACRRLARRVRAEPGGRATAQLVGSAGAAILTSAATAIVFWERFTSGVWVYAVLLPLLYVLLGYFRQVLGTPSEVEERVGTVVERGVILTVPEVLHRLEADRESARLLVPLDGSAFGDRSLPIVTAIAQSFRDSVILFTVTDDGLAPHLDRVVANLLELSIDVSSATATGPVAPAICSFAHEEDMGMIVMSTHGRTGARRRVLGSVTEQVVREAQRPVLVVPAHARSNPAPSLERIVVGLDGSLEAERILPFASSFARRFSATLLLVHAADPAAGKARAEEMQRYLSNVVDELDSLDVRARPRLERGSPDRAILEVAQSVAADMIMVATHGRGGVKRLLLGSVADSVVRGAETPVLLVPILERRVARVAMPAAPRVVTAPSSVL